METAGGTTEGAVVAEDITEGVQIAEDTTEDVQITEDVRSGNQTHQFVDRRRYAPQVCFTFPSNL